LAGMAQRFGVQGHQGAVEEITQIA
jgi:hypothetical protein